MFAWIFGGVAFLELIGIVAILSKIKPVRPYLSAVMKAEKKDLLLLFRGNGTSRLITSDLKAGAYDAKLYDVIHSWIADEDSGSRFGETSIVPVWDGYGISLSPEKIVAIEEIKRQYGVANRHDLLKGIAAGTIDPNDEILIDMIRPVRVGALAGWGRLSATGLNAHDESIKASYLRGLSGAGNFLSGYGGLLAILGLSIIGIIVIMQMFGGGA